MLKLVQQSKNFKLKPLTKRAIIIMIQTSSQLIEQQFINRINWNTIYGKNKMFVLN